MRILINIPSLDLPGGVANHYKGLLPFWSQVVKYNIVGRRPGTPKAICLLYDYIKFIFISIFDRHDIILLNPSLARSAIIRDSLFLAIAKLFHLRTSVFFHGWSSQQEELINQNPRSFARRFSKADSIIVLAEDFAIKLRSWGITSPIYLTTTKVDDRLISSFDINRKRYGKTILFLARIEESKGIFIALEAFSLILTTHPDARMLVAGSGEAMNAAIDRANSLSLRNIEFLGNLNGDYLVKAFSDSDVYLLPTTHGEGMPTSVLEAMAFGLPVITRPVGGLKDFFQNTKMGFISESIDPHWYATTVGSLFHDQQLIKRIGHYNHAYARERFLASKVAHQLEEIFERV